MPLIWSGGSLSWQEPPRSRSPPSRGSHAARAPSSRRGAVPPAPGAASAAGSGRDEVETALEASRVGVERRRALRRAARRRVAGETPGDGYLERSTVSAAVARQYRLSEASFV
eukprot:9471695-Pyramimonas_sp.AAC.1